MKKMMKITFASLIVAAMVGCGRKAEEKEKQSEEIQFFTEEACHQQRLKMLQLGHISRKLYEANTEENTVPYMTEDGKIVEVSCERFLSLLKKQSKERIKHLVT